MTDDVWKDDPSSDERWNAGVDFCMTQLCSVLGVDPESVTWDAATETVDGDVSAVIGNIMRAKYGENWDPKSEAAEARALAAEARLSEAERVLREARRFVDPDADPSRLTNRAMVDQINKALAPPVAGQPMGSK